jgi:hypothetical protein
MSDPHHQPPPQHLVILLAEGISDVARPSFRALANAANRLAAGLHLPVPRAAPRRIPGRRATQWAPAVVEDLLQTFAETLNRAAHLARSIAEAISEQRDNARDDISRLSAAWIEIEASTGEVASGEFTFWNTGSTVLSDVRFTSTDLISNCGKIPTDLVSFHPSEIDRVEPGEGVTVSVSVKPRLTRKSAVYHGAVTGEPGAAVMLLTLRSTSAR